jgi:hypothetical protein
VESLRKELGSFKVLFNPREYSFRVNKNEGNQTVHNSTFGDVFHPYVHPRGAICFGDATEEFADRMLSRNLKGCLQIIRDLLTSYDASTTPYVGLDEFRDVPEETCDGCGETESRCDCDTIRCDRCGEVEDNCGCSHCEECGVPIERGLQFCDEHEEEEEEEEEEEPVETPSDQESPSF